MKTGLTLGKYCPFHAGHQLVIETALAEVDHLIVMIYPGHEVSPIPLEVRAQWIRDLYPQVELIVAGDGPTEMGDVDWIKRLHEDFILQRLGGRRITHFYSSEFYGDHVSKALGAMDRRVDPQRETRPVSGTAARQDPFLFRHLIPPRVYRDLIVNAVLVGAPSTGKTTLARRLALEFNTQWMPEYGAEYWEANQVGRRLTLEQLVEIAQGHLAREDKLICEANQVLFTDTNAITTFMFSLHYHGQAHPRLIELARAAERRYDLTFLCDLDIPYEDTWDRSGEVNRAEFHQRIVEDLDSRGISSTALSGPVDERVNLVKEVLARFEKHPADRPY